MKTLSLIRFWFKQDHKNTFPKRINFYPFIFLKFKINKQIFSITPIFYLFLSLCLSHSMFISLSVHCPFNSVCLSVCLSVFSCGKTSTAETKETNREASVHHGIALQVRSCCISQENRVWF